MQVRNTSECLARWGNTTSSPTKPGIEPSVEPWQAYMLFAGLGVFTVLTAKVFKFIRKTVYKDKVSGWHCFDIRKLL